MVESCDIVIVGVCGAGKSVLVQGLRALGYPARACAQEHSYVQGLWARRGRPAALIYLEAGLDAWCDRILFVSADPSVRADRVGKARAWTPDEISRREAAQIPAEEKRCRAHAVVHNNGTPEETRAQVARLFRQWTPHNPSPPMRTGGRNHA